jgi:hypothetical protein
VEALGYPIAEVDPEHQRRLHRSWDEDRRLCETVPRAVLGERRDSRQGAERVPLFVHDWRCVEPLVLEHVADRDGEDQRDGTMGHVEHALAGLVEEQRQRILQSARSPVPVTAMPQIAQMLPKVGILVALSPHGPPPED